MLRRFQAANTYRSVGSDDTTSAPSSAEITQVHKPEAASLSGMVSPANTVALVAPVHATSLCDHAAE